VALSLVAVIGALHAGFGLARATLLPPADGSEIAVRLVQPAVNQGEKWDPERRDAIFRRYLEMSSAPPAAGVRPPELIVWPETSVPFLFQQRPDALAAIDQMLGAGQVLLAGAVRMEGESPADPAARFYNSVVAIDEAGLIFGAADKQFLVPLGEFVPFADLLARFGITKLVELPGGFTPGTSRPAIAVARGVQAVPYICYEVIFPGVAVDAPGNLLVNVTNDAWFGNSPGPYQHLRHAQLRAVEAGRPMLRAANSGITAVIDARGRILDALALDAQGVLDIQLKVETYAPLLPVGPATVGWSVVALMAIGALAGRARRRRLN
jgi:apolipoprotein N-acyltransferase